MRKFGEVMVALALVVTGTGVAHAQDWKAAVAAGRIGEGSDGYLKAIDAGLSSTAEDINLQRKKVYADRAAAEGGTVQAMGIAAGCNLIKRLPAGAKYRAVADNGAAGTWRTVGQGALQLDARCPQ